MLPPRIRLYACHLLTLFCITSYVTPLHASLTPHQPQEVVVELETQGHQIPLYLTQIRLGNSAYAKPYITLLSDILRFDVAQGAYYRLMEPSSQLDSSAMAFFASPQLNQGFWNAQGAHYLIMPLIENNKLALQVSNLKTLQLQTTPFVLLTGNIDEDRTAIHRLADSVHEAITSLPGIATTRILYTLKTQKDVGVWSSEVWESDYDGGNARKLVTGNDYCLHPVYVPPKPGERAKTLLYTGYSGGQPRLLYASCQEGKGYPVSTLKGMQLTPAVSWQRDKLAFVCDVKGSPDLFIQTFDPLTGKGSEPKRLFHADGASQSSPSFHPNGSAITFTSDKNGTPQVYVLSFDKPRAAPKLISRRARNGSASTFSPDGSKIAFSSKTEGVRQIWVYDCMSQDEQQLTFSPGHKENPTWAPDSMHLLYNGTSPGDYELYLLDLNKMKPTRLLTQAGEKRFPSWEPRLLTNSPINPL